MRIPSGHRNKAKDDGGSMTPMIDVVFLLLIFFICASARQMREAILPATLPPGSIEAATSVTAKPTSDQAYIHLRSHADGQAFAELNGTVYESLDGIELQLRELAKIASETPVILDIDGPVQFGDVIRIYDLCQMVQFETIKFAIDMKSN